MSPLLEAGIVEKDLRISDIIKNLKKYKDTQEISLENFKSIVQKNISIFEKSVNKNFIIPDFKLFKDEIEKIYDEVKKNEGGHNADYIPQLSRVNSDLFSVVFCSVDGQILTLGDAKEKFCVQSTSKAISYCIASELNGQEKVHQHVGREPSGVEFNEITLNNKNLPHNPMINAGAIMTCSLVRPDLNLADRFEYVTKIWDQLAGEGSVGLIMPFIILKKKQLIVTLHLHIL